jgi:hypothetical protein
MSPDGDHLYVASYGHSGEPGRVTEFDVGTGGQLALDPASPVSTGAYPYWIAVAPAAGPSASFTVQTAAPGSASTFTSTSTDADAAITNYDWSFGDGTTATGTSASHTYASAGKYTVTLTTADADGCSSAFPFFDGEAGPFNGVEPACSPDAAAQADQIVTIAAPAAAPAPTPTPAPAQPPPALPSNAFTITGSQGSTDGTITLDLDTPGPGAIALLGTHADSTAGTAALQPGAHRFVWGRAGDGAAPAGAVKVTLRPDKAALALLRRHAHRHWALHVRVWITYTPTGGYARSENVTVRVLSGR